MQEQRFRALCLCVAWTCALLLHVQTDSEGGDVIDRLGSVTAPARLT